MREERDHVENAVMDAATPRRIWTVGHSNHPLETFLALLEQNRIDVLVDVRSRPRSGYSPHFDRDALREAVTARGIRYAFFGETLGGRPPGDEFYDRDGHVRYDAVSVSDFFRAGIAKLERGVAFGHRACLMCSEEDPSVCHRRLLIARVLVDQRGFDVQHIRGDGDVQDETFLREDEEKAERAGGQQSLFDGDEAAGEGVEKAWRSLLSVLPKKPPPTSLGG